MYKGYEELKSFYFGKTYYVAKKQLYAPQAYFFGSVFLLRILPYSIILLIPKLCWQEFVHLTLLQANFDAVQHVGLAHAHLHVSDEVWHIIV